METWSDVLTTLLDGHEECDSLATRCAGELVARGWRALRPGDGGWEDALEARLETIDAEPVLRTRAPEGVPGLYHVVTRYQVAGRTYYDDPSARLGMRRGLIDPAVLDRWAKAGVTALATPRGIG